MVLAVQAKEREQKAIIEKIHSLHLPDRITIILVPVKDMCNKFYVNWLRNIAIRAIRTTHFLVLDMDLWPLGWLYEFGIILDNLYSEIISLPSSILESNSTAVILPSFFLKADPILNNCTTLMDCAMQ